MLLSRLQDRPADWGQLQIFVTIQGRRVLLDLYDFPNLAWEITLFMVQSMNRVPVHDVAHSLGVVQ